MPAAFIPKEKLTAYERWELGAFADPIRPEPAVDPGPDLDQVRATAAEEGREAGYQAGLALARAEAERLRALADAAERALAESEKRLANEVLDLALEIARQILRTDIRVRRESLLTVVREAIAALPQGVTAPLLALNPGDVDLVRAHVGDELAAGGFRVVEDHRVEPGGLRISAPSCELDATLATRWRRVVAALGKNHDWMDT